MIKIDLITGFLGSGKTTFIKKYAAKLLDMGLHVGIIESDHGAINIDMMFMQDLMDRGCDLEMVIGGNTAADHQRRFRTKLISMAMLGYDRIIVEPSGIYDPDEFFDLLHEEPLDRWYEAGNVITILDAKLKSPLSDASSYMLVAQAANAGAILLSRRQLAANEEVEHTLSTLDDAMKRFHCEKDFSSILIEKDWNNLTGEDWQKLMNCGIKWADHIKMPLADQESYDSLFFMNAEYPFSLETSFLKESDFVANLEDTLPFQAKEFFSKIKKSTEAIFSDSSCGNVIRIKGFISFPDDNWLSLNADAHTVSLEKAKRGQEVLIVIGEKLKKEAIAAHFNFNGSSDT